MTLHLISSAVFGEIQSHCQPWCRQRGCRAKTLNCCNIYVIIRDIYLNFGARLHYTIKGDIEIHFFFRIMPLFPLT